MLTSSPMLTTTATRSGSRGLLRPAACCLGALALGALALVYAAPAEAPSLFSRLKDRMKERYDANHILDERAPGMTCRDPDGPLMSGINSAVEWAVAKVPESRLHSLPVEAKLRVGLVTTTISGITIDALAVEAIRMRSCRKESGWLPNVLPDRVILSVSGVKVTTGLHLDSSGICGLWCVGGVAGNATASVTGTLNMTVSYEKANLTEVTDCTGDFHVGKTEFVGEKRDVAIPEPPVGLPISRIICYGSKPPGALMDALVDVDVTNTKTGKQMGGGPPFAGLVPLLNQKFAEVAPRFRQAKASMQARQEARRATWG